MFDVFLIILIIFLLAVSFSFILAPFAGSPPFPSTPKACQAIVDAIKKYDPDGKLIVEIGFAWAGLSMVVAKNFPDRKVIAYEISPFPWFIGKVRQKFTRNTGNLELRLGNAFKELKDKDVKPDSVYFYLCDDITDRAKMCLGITEKLVLANTYRLRDVEPVEIIDVGDVIKSKLYCYDPKKTDK